MLAMLAIAQRWLLCVGHVVVQRWLLCVGHGGHSPEATLQLVGGAGN